MPGPVLYPEEVGPADAARVLAFLNEVSGAAELTETLGLSEGPQVGHRIAAAILARRGMGPLAALDDLLAVTGVTLARFTEIVTALSGARPVPSGGTLRLVATAETLWLGQGVGIVGQVLDSAGRGVANATVTCIASSGQLSARAGTERQRGAAVSLTTEPGGVVRFQLGPGLAPALAPGPAAALQAELALLPQAAATPHAAREVLARLASRYRAEGAGLLRAAIDRLFDSFPAEAESPLSPWPVMPLTLIAVASGAGGRGEHVTVLTLRVRNWLGGWLTVLREAVAGDPRLDEALKHLDRRAEGGADLSQALIRATQAFAGLERGALGTRIRDEVAGSAVNRYVERVAPRLDGAAIINTVRTVGASKSAIAAGGFAVFEAIRATQDVQDTIIRKRPGTALDTRIDQFDARLGTLEANKVDRSALDGLRDDLLARTEDRLGPLQGRLDELESRRLDRTELETVEGRLSESFDARVSERLAELEGRVGALVDAARTDLRSELSQSRQDLSAQIDRKADATALSGLERSVVDVRNENTRLTDRLNTIRPIR